MLPLFVASRSFLVSRIYTYIENVYLPTSNLLTHCGLTCAVSVIFCAITCTVTEVISGIVNASNKEFVCLIEIYTKLMKRTRFLKSS